MSVSVGSVLAAYRNFLSVRSVPFSAVDAICLNGGLGAKAALHFQSRNYRFVPIAAASHKK